MNPKIWLSSPHIGSSEQLFVNQAFDTNWVAPLGPNVDGFENDISSFLGHTGNLKYHVAALNSGTAALHLALKIVGVGPGDYVFCQSFTFCGSANPIAYLGANPVFIDSEKYTWNMCPDFLKEAIETLISEGVSKERFKAIIPVHLYGMPAQMERIAEVASLYGIPVIEDAAEALGSSLSGKMCGTFGEMSVLSFNGNKIITTSGGGALVSKNEEVIKKARFLSTQARDQAPHYQHSQIGYNYRLSNVLAGIGRGQMEVLKERVSSRRDNNRKYREYFMGIDGITFQEEPSSNYFANYWLTCILIDPKNAKGISNLQVRTALEKDNIETRPLWKPMHLQPVFKDCRYFGSNISEEFFNSGICLPSGSNLTGNDFERIFYALDQIFK